VQHDRTRENFIRSGHGFVQTMTLFRGIQSTGHFGQGSRIVQEPGGIRQNLRNGQLNSPGTTSPLSLEQQSNHKSWWTSSSSGQDLWGHSKSTRKKSGPSTTTVHGAWCYAGAGATTIITSPTGVKYRYVVRLSFALESDRCTNNIVEYEAVILGLRKLRASALPHASS
jgi:hypothetical protein